MKAFAILAKKGRSSGNKFLIVKTLKTEADKDSRIGIIISKKTEKSAVKRNRAKRQVREIVRKLLSDIKPGYDAMITIKARFLELEFSEKTKAVEDVFARAGIIKS